MLDMSFILKKITHFEGHMQPPRRYRGHCRVIEGAAHSLTGALFPRSHCLLFQWLRIRRRSGTLLLMSVHERCCCFPVSCHICWIWSTALCKPTRLMIQLHRYFLSTIFHSLYQERRLFHWLRKWTGKCRAKNKKTYFRNKWWMLFSSPEPICASKLEWCHHCFLPLSLNVAAEASRSFIMMYYMHAHVNAHLDQRLQIGFDLLFYEYFCYFCLKFCSLLSNEHDSSYYLVLFLYICVLSPLNSVFLSL